MKIHGEPLCGEEEIKCPLLGACWLAVPPLQHTMWSRRATYVETSNSFPVCKNL